MPHSRHTEVRQSDLLQVPELTLLASSPESGPSIVEARGGRQLFVTGHTEYAADTLDREYRRDVGRGLPIELPQHYYVNDCPDQGIRFSWRKAGLTLYRNWVEQYVKP